MLFDIIYDLSLLSNVYFSNQDTFGGIQGVHNTQVPLYYMDIPEVTEPNPIMDVVNTIQCLLNKDELCFVTANSARDCR